jgi:SAM-dependent methyltransferase
MPRSRSRRRTQDAFGHALLDHLEGRAGDELIERDDGFVAVASRGLETYFAPVADWSEHERKALALAEGRCLDIGCGAGRFVLALQSSGLDVVGIDISPLAVEVCRRRGARDIRCLSILDADASLGRFDTIFMMGNNFGLFGSASRARRLLRRFRRITSESARIVGEVLDPYRTTEPSHLAYHELNRRRGRMGGQLRIRVRYKTYRTPWYDYLFVSPDEMLQIVNESGWKVADVIQSEGAAYVGVLERA